jgi:hypothetical protein
MKILPISCQTFGWNIKTHIVETEEALKQSKLLTESEKRMVGRFSQMPDLLKEELQDMNSAHFYDVLSEDPSFGTKNDLKNNALSKFMEHTNRALKQRDRKEFLKSVGYAAHYLQDAATPPHTEHGNYLHKLYRLPMHIQFEKGKKLGASSRHPELLKGYIYEYLPFSSLESLFHNTALFSVQPENLVGYNNILKWAKIQQNCFNRAINATKAYFDYILKFLPKENVTEVAKTLVLKK